MSQPKRKEETIGRETKGDEAIAYTFKELGIKEIFSPYNLPSFLAERLKQYEININYASSTREAVMLADSYAREYNTLGVVLQSPGVYLTEAIDIIAQAFMDSVPLLLVSTLRSYRDTGRSRIAELKTQDDLMNILAPITKMRERVVSIEEIIITIEKGYKEALSNRNRPVYIEIAEDLFKLKAYPLSPAEQKPEKKTPDKTTVAKVAEVLSNSKSPVIIAGYGVLASNSFDELKELAELLDSPVIATFRSKGVIPASHPLYAGEGLGLFATEEGGRLLDEADVILALGTRFTQLSTAGWSMKFKGYLIHNNVDGEDIGKVFIPQIPVVADTGLFLKELLTQLKAKIKEPIKRGSADKIKVYRKIHILDSHGGLWPYDVVRTIQQFKFDKIFIDLTAPTIDFVRLPIEKPFSWIASESLLERNIAISGIVRASNNKIIGVTDLQGVIQNLSIIQNRLNKSHGILLILNDNGSTTIDAISSDIPTISRTTSNLDIKDEILEKSLDAKTIQSISELKMELENLDENKLNVLNIKIEPDYKSVMF
ncbi:thiamine pyrophosphate-binding protein [Sulfurisphaera ohwakuensis]|uniref:2-oxoacid oxidoreductase (ferredoxin) n=1 Tax=Sulfurisphaera ohwakuensis TaxID=69656 RepID=A0A650CDI3_SULOH|nr:thiamine pyrophosphate-binding protein [Sulfurisphaera ohwakuensis]MBB5253256.1 thiamine pyrophosphate-dependent acetolactate synthase large subunit-like protein [Sulfurisphaera ohwakuensis]QGR15838.1 thiamine pyrophosphate-binding protein [Sulfurisphaera ohwakuensis]